MTTSRFPAAVAFLAVVLTPRGQGLSTGDTDFKVTLPGSVFDTIRGGRIAVLPQWLPPNEVTALRNNAVALHQQGHYDTDALAAYGSEKSTRFDPSRDRQVLRLTQWKDSELDEFDLRERFGQRMASLRAALAEGLDRPKLVLGSSVTKYGAGSTEISYTRYGPGAFLKRHTDEHHEELKGKAGWAKPTRRSISWLVYLNEPDWDQAANGGELRCFQRRTKAVGDVGASNDGDLQIGWLRGSRADPVERPVFLDSRRPGQAGNCALYLLDPDDATSGGGGQVKRYVSRNFFAQPVLFLAGDFFAQRLLIDSPALAPRFHFIEPPKSPASSLLASASAPIDEVPVDVPPLGGTLVLFDSVSLPHEVLPTKGRERWACSGWMHEDQQRPPPRAEA